MLLGQLLRCGITITSHTSNTERKQYVSSRERSKSYEKETPGSQSVDSIKQYSIIQYNIGPMEIDIMFLVSARMGFGHRMKKFHYSLFLKETLGKIRIIRFINILLPSSVCDSRNSKS